MPAYLTQYLVGMTGSYNQFTWVVPYKERDEIEASLLPVLFGNKRKRVSVSITVSPKGKIWIKLRGWANFKFQIVPSYRNFKDSDGWTHYIIALRDKATIAEVLTKHLKVWKKTEQARVIVLGGLMTVGFEYACPPLTEKEVETTQSKKKVIKFTIKRNVKPHRR